MSSRSDAYADERTREDDDLADYGDRPTDDRPGDDDPYAEDEGRTFPIFPSWGWGGAWGVMPWANREDEVDERYDGEAEHDRYGESEDDEDGGFGSLWDESLITLLIVGGAVLFVFPEPATSGLGVLLVTLGVLAWLVDWAM